MYKLYNTIAYMLMPNGKFKHNVKELLFLTQNNNILLCHMIEQNDA